MMITDPPFRIIAIAPFASPGGGLRKGLHLVTGIDDILEDIRPSLYIPLPISISPEGGITLTFADLSDFTPDGVIRNTPWLRSLYEEARLERAGQNHAKGSIDSILELVALPEGVDPGASRGEDRKLPPEADSVISAILTRVFSDEHFRVLEAAWRGAALLIEQIAVPDANATLEIIGADADSLDGALVTLEEELNCSIPSLLLVDIPFNNTPAGFRILEQAAGLAERLMTPAFFWCGPQFFFLDSWQGIDSLSYLPHYLEGMNFARWNSFKTKPAAFWSAAFCGRLLARRGYDQIDGLTFAETMPLAVSPVWGAAALMVKGKLINGKPYAISESALEGLSVDVHFSRERGQQFLKCGLVPFMQGKRPEQTVLPEVATVAGNLLSTPVIISRIIHALVQLREETGPCVDGEALQASLQAAFADYCATSGFLPPDLLDFSVGRIQDDGTAPVFVTTNATGSATGKESVEFTFVW